ncbi:hypothetical protein BC629DRAFT_1522643 [Irpex lacteus]|nr:hypothetical protein BC629DRAFT_1522643 [Irpex lacteus]
MVKLAKEANLRLDAIQLSEDLKGSLPIWLHLGISDVLKKIYNKPRAKCLRRNHGVTTVAQLHTIIEYGGLTTKNTTKHFRRKNVQMP